MSAITVDDDLIHYEVLGRGKPIILLHSWLGSWRYWVPTMQQLAVKYRCYSIDMWGFGDSGKNAERYTIDQQIRLIEQFMEKMGIPKVVLVGHGLGAVVAARFAARKNTRDRVHRLMLIAPPLYDLNPKSKALTTNKIVEIKDGLEAAPETLPIIPIVTSKAVLEEVRQVDMEHPAVSIRRMLLSVKFAEDIVHHAIPETSVDYDKLKKEVAKSEYEALLGGANSAIETNTFRDIVTIMEAPNPAPTVVVLGEGDRFVASPSAEIVDVLYNFERLKLLFMPNSQHYPMLEENALFVRLLKEFLEEPNVANLDLKEEWRRRKR